MSLDFHMVSILLSYKAPTQKPDTVVIFHGYFLKCKWMITSGHRLTLTCICFKSSGEIYGKKFDSRPAKIFDIVFLECPFEFTSLSVITL